MIRTYCDGCGEEITETGRLVRSHTARDGCVIGVEVMVSVNGTWNGGHVCKQCVIDAVLHGE
jgi:hypothetical protein